MLRKKFKDLTSNRIVEVTDQFEDIVILDNKSKIKMNQLLDKRMFEEYLDPNSFFRNESLLNSFTQQIKQLPLDDWKNRIPEESDFRGDGLSPTTQESAVLPYDPEVEKQELLRKAQLMYQNNTPQNLVKKQMDAMKDILVEDDDEEIYQAPPNTTQQNFKHRADNVIQEETKTDTKMDPILEMFKNVKRNTNFRIDFTVENKIPRIDFIEMMEDSYNTSIIDFLAQEFTDEILRDPTLIKDKIKNKLMDLVYPDVENRKKVDD
jgi:hypothetical protein